MIGEAMLELVGKDSTDYRPNLPVGNNNNFLINHHYFLDAGAEGTGRLTFSEFLELTCTFSTFGVKDLVKLCFFVIDREKSGLIDHQGLKHFLLTMWNNEANANSNEAIKRLDMYEDSYGQLTFEKLQEWVKAYPTAYYPMFRLQTSIMRTSFGEEWWNKAISDLQIKEERQKKLENMDVAEKNRIRHDQLVKEKEQVVYSQMGPMRYYLFWWDRKKVRSRVADVVTKFSRDDPRNADIRFCFDD
jgi:Ca2+-binding EF-hand superfamily protein